jgi:FixJ family two-component response regulator
MLRTPPEWPIRVVLVLNSGNLPSRLVENLEEARLRFELANGVKDVDHNDPSISCVLFPIRELPPAIVRFTLRRFVQRYPLIVIDDCANTHAVFEAGKLGAHELVEWPCDSRELAETIRRSRNEFMDASLGNLSERNATQLLRRLTERERQVVRGVFAGKVNKQMAADYGISLKTVEFHRSRAMKKLKVSSVAELVRLVMESEGRE